mmetsp:Transcript_29051/g.67332  ORF Transcript_29051/g.67332 Transcript_29051/m.67332 type:complete len:777 (+) Transcript_29051:27-2357(+)
MTEPPVRTQRVNRSRFNIPGQKAPTAQPASGSKPDTPDDRACASIPDPSPVKRTESQTPRDGALLEVDQPALKARKLDAETAPVPSQAPISAPTPSRNVASMPSGSDWNGVTVCFVSDLSSVPQAEVEKRIQEFGGKVGTAISQRTSILVLGGKLPDGRPAQESNKYQRFKELQAKGKVCAKILSEPDFLKLLPASVAPPATSKSTLSSPGKQCMQRPSGNHSQQQSRQSRRSRNWVDAFSPSKLTDLIGNPEVIRKLSDWLRDWDDVVLQKHPKKITFRPGSGAPENINARAALVSGPPGIGKTTTCRLVAQMAGSYEVLEYNASDARGQKVIQEMADGIAENTALSFAGPKQATRKVVIIMDEVDGMGAGDKGGSAALIKMIKRTRNPIICICNDQHSQQVRSLASNCYDLKFTRPPKGAIAQRCADIARRQGLQVDVLGLEALVESCGNDVRVVLNQLQMMTAMCPRISCSAMVQQVGQLGKDQDVMLSPFEACKKLLNASQVNTHSFRDRFEMFFVDHSMMGLMIQENYLRAVEKKPVTADVLGRCAYSADLMTVGDIMNQRMVVEQEWSLLPDCAVVACAYPTYVSNGLLAYPSFPTAMGKVSQLSKSRRLVSELQAHTRMAGTADRKAMVVSPYVDLLYQRLVKPLHQAQVQSMVQVLDVYGLQKEHVEHLTELRQHLGCQDLFKQVDAKVKAALTRELNSGRHAPKVVLPSKRRRLADEAEGDDLDDKESPSEDEGASALVKEVKSKAKAKAKAKSRVKSAKAKSQGST